MRAEMSDITITNREDEPIAYLKRMLNAEEIGIRVTKPRELRNDYICRNRRARNTLIYLLERLAACVVYKEVVNDKPQPVPPGAGFRLID